MKRSLIPKSRADRILAVLGCLTVVSAAVVFRYDSGLGISLVGGAVVLFFGAYVAQDQPIPSATIDEYSSTIKTIGVIGEQLLVLGKFLEKEQARVADTEAIIRKLNEEKTKLEPLVHTQREIVEAILAAHSERTVKHAWKERLFGFALGVVASLIASFVYEYFRR
jgi:sensor c-di-GMP phosphodiesterase-like protein